MIGLPDEKWGDRVYAVVAGRQNLDPAALLNFARSRLANYKIFQIDRNLARTAKEWGEQDLAPESPRERPDRTS